MTGKYFQALSRIPYSALSGKESGELYGKIEKKKKKNTPPGLVVYFRENIGNMDYCFWQMRQDFQ